MAKVFLFPDHLHTDRRISSCTQEAGLCAAPPTYGGSNAGRLRLATSGGVLEAATLDVALQTGGNPYGYRLTNNFAGSGAALRWKNSTDGSTSWRGYVDSPYFVRAWIIRAASGIGGRVFGGLKAIPNGKLGVTVDLNSGSGATFDTYSADYSLESNTIGTINGASTGDSDFVVMPSGRLVAFFTSKGINSTAQWSSYYSDTNGTSWSLLSSLCIDGDLAAAQISAQVVDDLIVVVLSTGGAAAQVWTSRDGGCTFEQTGTGTGTPANVRTCVTRSGQILAAQVGTVNTEVLPVIPGGGFGNAVQGNIGEYNEERAIVTRDDGTVWIFSGNTTGSNVADLACSVSIDDGATFSEAAGAQKVLNLHDTPTANALTGLRACSWRGRIVISAVTAADSGTDGNVIALEFGEWASVTDRRLNIASNGQPYEHAYIGAIDYPDALGWTRTDAAGGATVTNALAALRILCAANNTYYTASGTFWTGSAGVGKRLRFRVKVDTAGSVTQDHAFVRWSISDGANAQAVTIRFADTGFRVIDGAANVLADITEDMTNWTDFFVSFLHDATGAPAGAVSVWHRQDVDAEGLWTDDLHNGTVAEIGSAATYLDFGGDAAIGVTVDWSISNIQVADDDNGLAEVANAAAANPTELAGRPVPASVGMWLGRGLYVSGFNGAGVPGDTATVATTYQFAKENIWRELRPSKQVHSTADGAAWAVVFDAGSASVWSARYVAMFGTNVRQATIQFNASDSWGAPSVSQAVTTVLSSSSVGAGNRGPGYFGPTTSPGWIPHAYKSDGRFHRFFVEVGGSVYEIDDNDADRLYVADVDFSAASGTYYVFGDRGAVDLSSVQRYRFMRLLFPSQQTADDYYRLGTVFAALGWTPSLAYSHDFVDVTEPNVNVVTAENNLRGSASFGARRHSLQLQWTPINRMHGTHGKTGEEVEALYRALNGAHTPIAFWRDTSDVGTLGVYRVQNTLARPNLRGEGSTAVARVDLLTLSEEL